MLPEASTLLHWVSIYGYPFLGALLALAAAGIPIPIELVLLALGALSAAHNGPDFLTLTALGVAATVAGDALDYAVGRLLRKHGSAHLTGSRIAGRWRWLASAAGILERADEAWGLANWSGSGVMIFLSRCVLTPLEAPLSLLAGARRMPLARFLIWDALGEAVYVVGYLALGYTGAASLATSGPLTFLIGGVIVLATLGPLVAIRFVRRTQKQQTHPDRGRELTTKATTEHGERDSRYIANSARADAA